MIRNAVFSDQLAVAATFSTFLTTATLQSIKRVNYLRKDYGKDTYRKYVPALWSQDGPQQHFNWHS
jgi:hypothetical protein